MRCSRISAVARRVSAGAVLVAMMPALEACNALKDSYTANVAFTDGTGALNPTIPGQLRPFDLLVDCMPSDITVTRQTDGRSSAQCPTPTMRKISDMGPDDQAALARNRFQDYLIWRSEQMCESHKAGILGTQSTVNFVMNTVTTGVAAVAAIVTAPASSILAAIAAITSGTRSHFNEDVYEKLIAPAVVKKISEDRTQKLLAIQNARSIPATPPSQGRVPVSINDYTLEQSIGDVERYNQLCSFGSGLASLVDPKQKFQDTAAGVKQRIDTLRAQLDDNRKQIAGPLKDTNEARRLAAVNEDIVRQIMVLQQQMLTAPLSVDAPAGGK